MTLPTPTPHGVPAPRRKRDHFTRSWRFKTLIGMTLLAYPSLKYMNHGVGRNLGTVTYIYKSPEFLQAELFTDPTNDQYELHRRENVVKDDTSITSFTKNATGTQTTTCLSETCIEWEAQKLARAFPDRTNKNEWCLQDSHSNKGEGLILVKVPKAASSTCAGVALRIADRHNCQALQWQHKPGKTYQNRNPKKSFLLTSIRDPASRILSYLFFMEVSIGRVDYSEEWILDRLQHFSGRYGSIEDGQGGFTMQFAALEQIPEFSAWSPKDRETVQNPKAVQERVQRMLEGYDFMLVVDRMDESLVALALLMDIDVGDVLVTSSKVAGSYFYDPPRHQCVALTKTIVSPAVQEYLDSNDWKAQNYGDYLLHAAASHSLDLTIERLGRHRFDVAMERYKTLKAMEKETCAPVAEFPCSKSGKPQPKKARKGCYQRDFGCGYKCIDDMIANYQEPGPAPRVSSPNIMPTQEASLQAMEYSSFA